MNSAVLTLLFIICISYGKGTPVVEPTWTKLVGKGESVQFTCSGNGTGKWTTFAKSQMKHVKLIGNSSVVQISAALYTDTGTYTCEENHSNASKTTSVHLFVKDPRQYWYAPRGRIAATEYSNVTIDCLITDPSIYQVYLKKKDKNKQNVSFSDTKGFTIHNVQKDDEGTYVCVAMVNGQPKSSSSIDLRVKEAPKYPPSVTLESAGLIRIQGEPTYFTCQATSYTPLEIKWETPEKKDVSGEGLGDNVVNSIWITNSKLRIASVKLSDSGNYTCIGKNGAGNTRRSTFLQVLEKGFVKLSTFQNSSIAVTVGKNLDLQVQIEAYPNLTNAIWLHKHLENNTASIGEMLIMGSYRNESILSLKKLKENESGNYTFLANNSEATASITFEIIVQYPPRAKISLVYFTDETELKCKAWGNPLPTIEWYRCPSQACTENRTDLLTGNKTIVERAEEVESVLKPEGNLDKYTIFCKAHNFLGSDSAETTLPRIEAVMMGPPFPNTLFITAIVVAALLLLLSIFLYYKYKQKPKYEVRWQIVQVGEGNHYTCIDPTQLPYNEKWEFPRANLHFGKTLGAGAFGKVIEATAFGMGKDDSALKVAVKMLKPSAHTDEVEALMSELKILSHLGHHQHIVNLLGACTSGGPILVITEYCQYGDLLNFLRKKADAMNDLFIVSSDYKNMSMEQKYIRSDSGFSSQDLNNYIEMKPVSKNSNSIPDDSLSEEVDTEDNLPLDLYDLLHFSLQVAQGMSFLASKSCIHRDVAARNVLVTQGRIAKICDFGLARDIENDSNYVVKGNARLPVKWMAPESIFDCIYTVQSDVWSYGILLWEIFSLGRSPYPGILVNRKFYKLIKEGYKMDCPNYSPLDVYRIMKACWNLEPTRRPTFNEISCLINKQMSMIKEQDYANISQTEEEQECEDTKCEAEHKLIVGNNYQFC